MDNTVNSEASIKYKVKTNANNVFGNNRNISKLNNTDLKKIFNAKTSETQYTDMHSYWEITFKRKINWIVNTFL